MTPSPQEVAPGVWVVSGPRHAWHTTRPHREDLAASRGLAPWRAAEFLAGRAALRHLLSTVRPDLADRPVRPDPRGRPRLAGRPDVGISISHDGAQVAAAVAAGRRVGVDVQQPLDGPCDRLLRRCLRDHTERLATLPARRRAEELAWVWTVQEACVKAAGTGLAGRPWSIDVPPGQCRGRWSTYAWVSLRASSPVPLSCAFSDPLPPADLEQTCPSPH